MSIFSFKKKEKEEKKTEKPDVSVKAKKTEKKTEKETVRQTVVTPDGRLVETNKKVEAKPKKAKAKKEETGQAYRILMHPLVTEKSSYLSANNQYVFAVTPHTNKVEVRKAIYKVYGVQPVNVTIMNVRGKKVRYGRTEGVTKRWKKAIVTLAQGQKIEIQEGL